MVTLISLESPGLLEIGLALRVHDHPSLNAQVCVVTIYSMICNRVCIRFRAFTYSEEREREKCVFRKESEIYYQIKQ